MLFSDYVDKFYKSPTGDIEKHPSYIQYKYMPTREYKICAIIVKHVNDYPDIKIRDLINLYINNINQHINYKIKYKITTIGNMIINKARIEEIMQLFSDDELNKIFNI
tara:strand:- start:372 stop:695 length:324 start_codon:yes stop_codon:yes gene_type:complete